MTSSQNALNLSETPPTTTVALPQCGNSSHNASITTSALIEKENQPLSVHTNASEIQHIATVSGAREKDLLSDATMEDVTLSDTAVNIVAVNRKTHLTRLESIKSVTKTQKTDK